MLGDVLWKEHLLSSHSREGNQGKPVGFLVQTNSLSLVLFKLLSTAGKGACREFRVGTLQERRKGLPRPLLNIL